MTGFLDMLALAVCAAIVSLFTIIVISFVAYGVTVLALGATATQLALLMLIPVAALPWAVRRLIRIHF